QVEGEQVLPRQDTCGLGSLSPWQRAGVRAGGAGLLLLAHSTNGARIGPKAAGIGANSPGARTVSLRPAAYGLWPPHLPSGLHQARDQAGGKVEQIVHAALGLW